MQPRKRRYAKCELGVLVGLGLNLIDTLLSALAPPSLKSMFGLAGADEDIYGPALADYVAMDDYVALEGAPPIENHLTLSDYIAVGDTDLDPDMEGLESELGNIEQDLGAIENDMGDEAYEDLGGADAYQGTWATQTRPTRSWAAASWTSPIEKSGESIAA